MREIKFRAWDKHEGKWLFGYDMPNLGGFNLIGEVVLFGELAKFSLDYYKHIVFMQFTGLYDKNGKEIYEGDILKLDDIICQIHWSDGAFQIVTSEHQGRSEALQERVKRFEVIGNIYENPD